jgi:hypothetical protein
MGFEGMGNMIRENLKMIHRTTPSAPSGNAPFFVDKEVIRLTKNGVWLSDDVEIDHEQTIKIFARGLERDAQGVWQIRVGRETKRIEVEDTAYFVTRVEGTPERGYEIWLSDETREHLDPSTLTYRPGRLTCRIKTGREEAKFLSAAYFDLLKELDEDADTYWLDIQGQKVVLSSK